MANTVLNNPNVINRNGSFESPYSSLTMRYHNSDQMNGTMASSVKRSVTVSNCAKFDITVMHPDGMTQTLPKNNMALDNRVVVIVKYDVTPGVTVPWNIVGENLPEPDKAFLSEIQHKFENEANYGKVDRTIEFYYSVTVDELPFSPNGIYLAPATLQFVASEYANHAIPYSKQIGMTIADFTSDKRVSQAVTCATVYFVNNIMDVTPLFYVSPWGVMSIKPTYDASRPEGVYVMRTGDHKSLTGDHKDELQYIPVPEFMANGYFRGWNDYVNNKDRFLKQYSKSEIDKIYSQMESFLSRNANQTEAPKVEPKTSAEAIVDKKLFGGYSLRDLTAVFQELGKLSSAVEKVVNPGK